MENNTYLVHYAKGEKSKKAKYKGRIWEQDHWKYVYDDKDNNIKNPRSTSSNNHQDGGYSVNSRNNQNQNRPNQNNSRYNPRNYDPRQNTNKKYDEIAERGKERKNNAEAERLKQKELRDARKKSQDNNISEKVQNDRYEAANKAIASGREKEAENRRKQVEDNAKDFSDDRTLNTYDQSTDRVRVYNAKKNVDKFVKTLSIPFKQMAANMDYAYRLLKTWMSTPSVSSKRR